MKEVGLKPGVKERWSYRCTKWWIGRGRSDGWRNRWVRNGGNGARMRFTKRQLHGYRAPQNNSLYFKHFPWKTYGKPYVQCGNVESATRCERLDDRHWPIQRRESVERRNPTSQRVRHWNEPSVLTHSSWTSHTDGNVEHSSTSKHATTTSA